jgi:superfamily II DNA or RNA helicase
MPHRRAAAHSEKPVVVVSDEPQAHARIDRFARGDANVPRWLIAVDMVSEGADVPRLVLAAYATVKRTDLFFRHAVGRLVRRRTSDRAELMATVFLPADPALKACAERVEVPVGRSSFTRRLRAIRGAHVQLA